MSYTQGQMVALSTAMSGVGTPPTMTLTVTAPDGTTTLPTVSAPSVVAGGWTWTATVHATQEGDYHYLFVASGTYVGVDEGQFHVVAPVLRIVGLGEVKEHGNITSSATDRELLGFISTAQQMIEDKVGAVVPTTVTAERHTSGRVRVWLRHAPVIAVTSVQEWSGSTLVGSPSASEYVLDGESGALSRVAVGGAYSYWLGIEVRVTYRAGRAPVPEAIRWAAKELTIHLWRSTQALRGGRARGADDAVAVGAGFGLPNRVQDALAPFLKAPAVY